MSSIAIRTTITTPTPTIAVAFAVKGFITLGYLGYRGVATEKEVNEEADYWEEQDEERPEQLRSGIAGTFENLDDRDDVQNKDK